MTLPPPASPAACNNRRPRGLNEAAVAALPVARRFRHFLRDQETAVLCNRGLHCHLLLQKGVLLRAQRPLGGVAHQRRELPQGPQAPGKHRVVVSARLPPGNLSGHDWLFSEGELSAGERSGETGRHLRTLALLQAGRNALFNLLFCSPARASAD